MSYEFLLNLITSLHVSHSEFSEFPRMEQNHAAVYDTAPGQAAFFGVSMKISAFFAVLLVGCLSLNIAHASASAQDASKATQAAKLADNEGIVVSHMDAGGYTYMELDNGGNKFWIAAPTTTVNNGDHVRFVENMVMTNFTSKTLNRTFSTLIFVTSTEIKK